MFNPVKTDHILNNATATQMTILPGDIERNRGPRKKINLLKHSCQHIFVATRDSCKKPVLSNAKRFICSYCKNVTRLICSKLNNIKH